MKNKTFLFGLYSAIIYFIVFWRFLIPGNYFLGNDIEEYFFPIRSYVHEKSLEGVFPFWTERILSGFPIYSDPESGILNPLNLALIRVFGPFSSYKIEHFILYMLGSLAFYEFLKKKNFSLYGIVTSHFIYFFNFFAILHQQHISLIFNYYLIPVHLMFADRLSSKTNVINTALLSLSTAFGAYFGGFQLVLMSLVLAGMYLLIFCQHKIKNRLLVLFNMYVLVVILVFPLVFTIVSTHKDSGRKDTDFREGSFLPTMALNAIYPSLFDGTDGYFGSRIDETFNRHEVYFYVGIFAMLIAIASYLTIRDEKILNFSRALAVLFLILAFLEYSPFSHVLKFLPFAVFRYWGRSAIFLVIAVSILAGALVSNLPSFNKVFKPRIVEVFSPVLFLSLLTVLNLSNKHLERFFRYLNKEGLFINMAIFIFSATILAALLFILSRKFEVIRKYSPLIVAFIICADLAYFGSIELKDMFGKISLSSQNKILNSYENNRVIFVSKELGGNEKLYYQAWGVTGYSPLVSNSYSSLVSYSGLKAIKRTIELPKEVTRSAMMLGATSVIDKDSLIHVEQSSVIGEDGGAVNIQLKKEGGLEFEASSKKGFKYNTFIRNYPGWEVKIDGDRIKLEDGVFIVLNVPSGFHKVTMHYAPNYILTGFLVSLAGILIWLVGNKYVGNK